MLMLGNNGTFASRLRAARRSAGMRQNELAVALGQQKSALSLVEAGKRLPFSSETVLRAAKILGVDPGPLLVAAAEERQQFEVPYRPEDAARVAAALADLLAS